MAGEHKGKKSRFNNGDLVRVKHDWKLFRKNEYVTIVDPTKRKINRRYEIVVTNNNGITGTIPTDYLKEI